MMKNLFVTYPGTALMAIFVSMLLSSCGGSGTGDSETTGNPPDIGAVTSGSTAGSTTNGSGTGAATPDTATIPSVGSTIGATAGTDTGTSLGPAAVPGVGAVTAGTDVNTTPDTAVVPSVGAATDVTAATDVNTTPDTAVVPSVSAPTAVTAGTDVNMTPETAAVPNVSAPTAVTAGTDVNTTPETVPVPSVGVATDVTAGTDVNTTPDTAVVPSVGAATGATAATDVKPTPETETVPSVGAAPGAIAGKDTGVTTDTGTGTPPETAIAATPVATPDAPPNTPPSIKGVPQTDIIAGETYDFIPEAKDADDDSLAFAIDGMPSWARFDASNGTLTGAPLNSDVGTISQISISVTDGKAVSRLDSFSLRVIASNTPPVLSGEPTTRIKTGETYRFTPLASDKDGDALVYSVVALPAWAQFDATTGEIVGNPVKTDAGDYEGIEVQVSDGKLSSSIGPFAITVSLSNSAPEISGTPVTTVAGKSKYLFTPSTTDVDGDSLVFTIDHAPAWAAFDTTTGALSGTPGNDQAGNYPNIVIGVSDGRDTARLAAFSIEVTYTNTAPVISGEPVTWIQPGANYTFTPATVDSDPNTTLTYSVQNLPAWATLDTTTGTISGTAGVEALHRNIVLRVSDGQAFDELPFFIRVRTLQDFARSHGVASQGSIYGAFVAQNAIDGDTATYNHTGCSASGNWWQVAMPTEIEIHRVEITSRNTNLYRINDAGVYISSSDYKELPADAPVRSTLEGKSGPQVFTYDPPLNGSRVAIKASAANCLHLSDVKVFGRGPDAPLLAAQQNLMLPMPFAIGDFVGKIDAVDLQGDTVTYALSGDKVPFAIDNDGKITVNKMFNYNATQTFDFTVTASDSVNESVTRVHVGLLSRPGANLERWTGISGTQIADLTGNPKYLLPADQRAATATLDTTGGYQDNYGLRLTSYLRPLVTGDYYLSIAGDDATALEISPTTDAEKAKRVVSRTYRSSYQGWSQSAQSGLIHLQAGSAYFVRALLKDGSGNDHVSVGWRKRGESSFTEIPYNQLFRTVVTEETVKPTFKKHETKYLLSQASSIGTEVATIAAIDGQKDSLVYSIVENAPFSVSQSGVVTVSGPITPSKQYTFTVSATDGTNVTNTVINVTTTIENEVEHAIDTGDAFIVSRASLIEDEILATIARDRSAYNDALNQIMNLQADGSPKADGSSLTSLRWNPTHDAALLGYKFGENKALLTTNNAYIEGYVTKEKTLAVIGQSNARYIAMGGNPMRNYRRNKAAVNEQMHKFMENSMAWLTRRTDLKTKPFNVVIANMYEGQYFPDERGTREWLDQRFPQMANYNQRSACDDSALAGCITAATNLLILSSDTTGSASDEKAVVDAAKSAMAQGIPVLYMHLDGITNSLSTKLFPLFDITIQHDNVWHRLEISDSDQRGYMNNMPESIVAIQKMMLNFKQQSFNIDWTQCDKQKPEKCSLNESLTTGLWDGAKAVQSSLRSFDAAKVNIFKMPQRYRLEKLLALLGDFYRRDVVFPIDSKSAPGVIFPQAFFADHAQYQYRDKVGVWSDLGNFSRTDFSHITPTTRRVKHTSKRNFKSTGAYALPGQKVTVTRNDDSVVGVKVFVNSTRDPSTHVFAKNGYNRPRFMQGARIPIKPGETISFISSIGGPIQLEYDTNDLPVDVTFSNVGEHAYWRSVADNESFTAKLAAAEFDWAEVAAPSFEVHSKTDKMQQSVKNPVLLSGVGDTQALVDSIMAYVHNAAHTLAGFKGPGIDVVPEIHQFAVNNGLEVQNLDLVKHMNADQATCGYGCSGNPYDAYWSFNPIGHGDLHEVGHGLEKARFRLTGWPGHASTNFYSFYAKHKYYDKTGADPTCGAFPFETVYNYLQNSIKATAPKAYLKATLWKPTINYSYGATQIVQMMMSAQDVGALKDGWHLLARLHIIERAYQKAVNNDDKWLATRAGLGMGLYERAAAKGMSTEDWLVIAASHAAGYDFRAYFDTWGHTYSAEASAQVAALGLPPMPLNYFVVSGDGICKGEGFDGVKLPLDGGNHVWTREGGAVAPETEHAVD